MRFAHFLFHFHYYMFFNAEVSDFDKPKNSLEPRLMEYIKKRKFYKENNIDSPLMEKEFSIDKNDIEKIKNYFKGKKVQSSFKDEIEHTIHAFPSESLKKDERLQKIKNKQKRDKDALEQKNNYDALAREFDMYRDDRQFASAFGDDFKSRFNPQVWMDDNSNGSSEDEGPTAEQIIDMKRRYANPNIYKNKKPKIDYEQYISHNSKLGVSKGDYSLDSIMGDLNTYNERVGIRDVSPDLPITVNKKNGYNNNREKNNREKENNYRAVPQMTSPYQKDVNIENYLSYGQGPSRGQKSLGYPNPAEHYFQYISNDISKAEHTVFEPGMPTRMNNKETARPMHYKRDM